MRAVLLVVVLVFASVPGSAGPTLSECVSEDGVVCVFDCSALDTVNVLVERMAPGGTYVIWGRADCPGLGVASCVSEGGWRCIDQATILGTGEGVCDGMPMVRVTCWVTAGWEAS